MKILIVSLLQRKISPRITAARPRVIYELCRGLVNKGHQVTILGTGDSYVPGAKIIPVINTSFINQAGWENPFYAETAYLTKLAKTLEKIAPGFDIVHNHTYPEFINLLVENNFKTPMLTTVHAQMTPAMDEALSLFKKSKLICISQSAKKLAVKANIWKVIYNGVDTDLYKYQEKKQDYLFWLGRLSKAKDKKGKYLDPKGIRWAIALARKTNSKLLLSGNVEDIKFFNQDVKPYLNKKIKWVGPITAEQPLTKKQVAKLMAGAKAFLMTVNWQEPFGLVMAEAMSCGTPVVGFNKGAVSELIKHNKTGYLVDYKSGVNGLVRAVKKIHQINPQACRQHVEKNFSLQTMTANYIKAYQQLVK